MSKKNSRLPFIGLLVGLLVMAGCASPTPAATEAPQATEAMTEMATAAPTEAPTEAAASNIDCMGAASGDTISMLYQWSGTEEESLNQILKPLIDACGIVLKPEATRDPAVFATAITGGTPPDVVFWGVPQLTQYKDKIVPVTDLGMDTSGYADFWQKIGTVDGKMLGMPVKADIKTIIWYSPAAFTADSYSVPKTWADLDALVEKMVADGKVPWSMGFGSDAATGWTGSDFIQDILLVTKGPDYVNGIIDGSVPYNDAGVKEAYMIYGKWASDAKYTVGGANGTVSTAFGDALLKPFSDPPEAMMVKQSGFAGDNIKKAYPDLTYGTDYDFFGVPGAQGVQGGSDWLMAFSDKAAVKALVAYLSSETGAKNWAANGGLGLTPNSAGAGAYTAPALVKYSDILATAKGFTPDMGDSIPDGFGTAEWKAIISYVNGGDLDAALADVAKVQAEALKP
jgi:alpha-glucoside transport system substrate-binding protein